MTAAAPAKPAADPYSGHPEAFGPALMMHGMGLLPLTPERAALYRTWCRQQFRPDWNRWVIDASRNWDTSMGGGLLWDGPVSFAYAYDPLLLFLRCQIGETPPPAEVPELGLFGGAEENSCVYEAGRWGPMLALRKLALQWPHDPRSAEILRLTARYSQIQMAIGALFGAPPVTQLRIYTLNGKIDTVPAPSNPQHWAHRRWYTVVGGRSDPAATFQSGLAAMLAIAAGVPPHGAWAEATGALVARQIPGSWSGEADQHLDPGLGFPARTQVLDGVRFMVPIHVLRWPGRQRLVYMERRPTALTPCFYFDYAAEGTAHLGFPWPPGARDKNASGDPGSCEIADGHIVAKTPAGIASVPLPPGDPIFHAVIGPSGYKELA